MLSTVKYSTTLILVLTSMLAFAQCEDLNGNGEGINNWKEKYQAYFGADSATPLIQADSVLIFYVSNPDNETNYGMPCCYHLADKYAQTELAYYVKRLTEELQEEDAVNFLKAQKAWQMYYESEWDFLRNAFIAYANFSKYGQGREIMIETQIQKYQMIKSRVLIVKRYIETATID